MSVYDTKGKADGLEVTVNMKLGEWRHWPGDIVQYLRVWQEHFLPTAAWVRKNSKGTHYDWCAWSPDNSSGGRVSSGWRSAETDKEARDAADDWLIANAGFKA